MNYQRKRLSTGEDVGEPGPLPVRFRGLSDDVLADLGPLGLPDTGFFPVEPEPQPQRWIHKSIFIQRLTQQERLAITAARATDPVVDDLLYVLEQSEQIYLDLTTTIQGLAYLVAQGLLEPHRPAELRA